MSRGTAVRRRQAPTTRERILQAAVLRFSRHSYEETGLRDIAADVGVDVAYVHRCFGSKRRLFAEAVEAAVELGHILSVPAPELPGALTRRTFSRDLAGSSAEVGPLDILIRSLGSTEAMGILREFTSRHIIAPLSQRLDGPARRRAALITAFLAGIAIFRTVLRVEELREAGGGELERTVAQVVRALMEDDCLAGSA